DSAVSFQKNFTEPMQRQLTLFGYAQDGWRARTYDDGNAAFANGEVAMLMQGIWALNPIRQANPDVDAAIFPYPAPEGEGADQRLLVTGVDVVVTMGKGAAHPEEARRFFDYLFQPEVIEKVAKSQSMFPSLREADYPDDPAIQELAPFFDGGHIAGFVDHHV
nr:extracellular solute-binding protein [Streptococcus anginosus]